jgi:hypothetical protein
MKERSAGPGPFGLIATIHKTPQTKIETYSAPKALSVPLVTKIRNSVNKNSFNFYRTVSKLDTAWPTLPVKKSIVE